MRIIKIRIFLFLIILFKLISLFYYPLYPQITGQLLEFQYVDHLTEFSLASHLIVSDEQSYP